MKKCIIFILALMTVLMLAPGCSEKKSEENTSETQNKESQLVTGKEPEVTTDLSSDSDDITGIPDSAEDTEPPAPPIPPFDKTAAWDGKNACFDWYVNGDYKAGYQISDAYDLYGLSLLTTGLDTGKIFYYDANYMLILDSDGDGEVSDEVGYDANQLLGGDKFAGCTVYLAADIDLNGQHWLPIGSSGSFQGFFEGQQHTVKNFAVDGGDAIHEKSNVSYYGFFAGVANGAEIKDLTVSDAVITIAPPEGHDDVVFVGTFGTSYNNVLISNCHAYDITVKFDSYGKSLTFLGYALARIDNAATVIENCSVYHYNVEGLTDSVTYANEWIGVDKTNSVVPTECSILTSDPRK